MLGFGIVTILILLNKSLKLYSFQSHISPKCCRFVAGSEKIKQTIKSYKSSHNKKIKMIGIDSTSFSSILPTLASVSAISFVTAFHEAGHFLAARLQGIVVQSYNVGIGPKIISFNDTNNIEYNFRLLPLGGYVAFPSNLIEDENGNISEVEDENPDLLQNRNPWERAIVICGGVIANVFLSFLIYTYMASSYGITNPVYDSGLIVNSRVIDAPGK